MKYKIQNEVMSAEVKTSGAALTSIRSFEKGEYLWGGDSNSWASQAPFLFPFVGGLRDGKTYIDGVKYEMGRHGFIRMMEFEKISGKDDEITLSFRANSDTRRMFPFEFSFTVTYRLEKNKIHTIITVKNHGDGDMPFCVGGHPGFKVPLEEYEDYVFSFDRPVTANCMTAVPSEGLVDVNTRTPFLKRKSSFQLSHDLFKVDAVIFDRKIPHAITLQNPKTGHGVRMEYPDFDYLGIWSTAKKAGFVCIEPWTGYSTTITDNDNFREKKGITTLKTGESKTFTYSVELLG